MGEIPGTNEIRMHFPCATCLTPNMKERRLYHRRWPRGGGPLPRGIPWHPGENPCNAPPSSRRG